MPKPLLVMDQHFRQVEELFRPGAFAELGTLCKILGGANRPMDRDAFLGALPMAEFVVAARPELTRPELDSAPELKAVIEVSGTFQAGLDYDACMERGIEVLSCAPGFRRPVAEMALGLMIAGGRGIMDEHERFRAGSERWFNDNVGTDFSLYGQTIGFVGFGSIAQECMRLLQPFAPQIRAFDPWLKSSGASFEGVCFVELEELLTTCRCVVIAAVPTDENHQLVSRGLIEKIPHGALVVVISRSHLVDFDALVEAAEAGHIRLASDVFPSEPVSKRATWRQAQNVIWSPHRAAAVEGGRHQIGDMIVHDVRAILSGSRTRHLQVASLDKVRKVICASQGALQEG